MTFPPVRLSVPVAEKTSCELAALRLMVSDAPLKSFSGVSSGSVIATSLSITTGAPFSTNVTEPFNVLPKLGARLLDALIVEVAVLDASPAESMTTISNDRSPLVGVPMCWYRIPSISVTQALFEPEPAVTVISNVVPL